MCGKIRQDRIITVNIRESWVNTYNKKDGGHQAQVVWASKENTRGFCTIKRNKGRLRKTIREIWYYMIEHDDVV